MAFINDVRILINKNESLECVDIESLSNENLESNEISDEGTVLYWTFGGSKTNYIAKIDVANKKAISLQSNLRSLFSPSELLNPPEKLNG